MQASPNRSLPPSTVAVASTHDGEPLLARVVRELSLLDWFVLAYHTILVSAAFFGQGPARATCLLQTGSLWTIFAVSLFLVRGNVLRHPTLAPLLHRVAMYGTFQASYFFLRDLLPLASPHSLDEQLHRIDLALFGVEPTLWVDRFITPATTEWFSFFYYSYFFLLAIHVMPFIFAGKNRGLFPEFVMAIVGVYGVSQLVYFLVPGYGPYRALAGQFPHETLPRGFFQDLVQGAVSMGGAQKDIFPSLHTGGPFTIALFSFLHRDRAPFKYTWPVMMFFSLQIIGATIFLRWHWAIDILAGLALSTTVTLLAGRVSAWEQRRRAERGLMPVWLDVGAPRHDASATPLPVHPSSHTLRGSVHPGGHMLGGSVHPGGHMLGGFVHPGGGRSAAPFTPVGSLLGGSVHLGGQTLRGSVYPGWQLARRLRSPRWRALGGIVHPAGALKRRPPRPRLEIEARSAGIRSFAPLASRARAWRESRSLARARLSLLQRPAFPADLFVESEGERQQAAARSLDRSRASEERSGGSIFRRGGRRVAGSCTHLYSPRVPVAASAKRRTLGSRGGRRIAGSCTAFVPPPRTGGRLGEKAGFQLS